MPFGNVTPRGHFWLSFSLTLAVRDFYEKTICFLFCNPPWFCVGFWGFWGGFLLLASLGLAFWLFVFPVCTPLPLGISRQRWGFPVGSAGGWKVAQSFLDVAFECWSARGRRCWARIPAFPWTFLAVCTCLALLITRRSSVQIRLPQPDWGVQIDTTSENPETTTVSGFFRTRMSKWDK